MINLILIVLLFQVTILFAAGQDTKKSCPDANNILISKDRPTVYTAFEREGGDDSKTDSGKPVEAKKYFWIRVHNNTHWAITSYAEDYMALHMNKLFTSQSLCTGNHSVLRDGEEIDAEYYVNARAGSRSIAPEIYRHNHTSGPVWIAPGNSLIFKVSQEYINKDWEIVVPFRYEWEEAIHREYKSLDDIARFREPRHFVYFYYYQLPESVKNR